MAKLKNIFRFLSFILFFSGLLLMFISATGIYAKDRAKDIENISELDSGLEKNTVVVSKVTGVIGPATNDYIVRNIKYAEEIEAEVLILEMHTPGGLVSSMQDIVQNILASKVPVVTFVSPPGSHAASAGTYILYASHVAAMAPGTNIGAATPVQMTGNNPKIEPDSKKDIISKGIKSFSKNNTPPPKRGDAVEYKSVNDAAAYIRGLAEMRGRSVEWAEKAVRNAKSLTVNEAKEEGVIEIIAEDINDLLQQLDGRSVKMADGDIILQTKDAIVIHKEPSWRIKILSIITNPNIAFLFMTLGGYGLIYEFANPGSFIPGVMGIICLIIGLFAMNILPVNYTGAVLILLGMGFMVAEAFSPSFGIMGIGGALAFALGATILIDADAAGIGISWWTIASVTGGSFLMLTIILGYALKAQKKPVVTGIQGLIGSDAEILNWADGRGEVRATGEVWQAIPDEPRSFRKGDRVKITDIDGLKLIIAPVNAK